MSGKSIVKIVLDIVMAVLYIALLFAYGTGLVFHEIAGLLLMALFALHLGLNWKWVAGVAKRAANGEVKRKSVLMGLLAAGLLVGVVTVGATGLMVSMVVLPAAAYQPGIAALHKWSAWATAALMAVHVLVHAKYLAAAFKKLFTGSRRAVVRGVVSGSFALLVAAGAVYRSVAVSAVGDVVSGPVAVVTADSDSAGGTEEESTPVLPPAEEAITNGDTAAQGKKEEEEASVSSSAPPAETAAVTLDDYLGKLYCTACGKHCPLSSPRCGRSAAKIEQATVEYNTLYGQL